MRRTIALVLIGLGTAFLVLAPMVKFYAVPKLTVAPLDLDPAHTSNNSGTVSTVIDLATGTEKQNVALNSIRRTKADVAASQQAGDNTAVYDSLSVISLASDSTNKPYLPSSPERYAFDRTTSIMKATAGTNVGGTPITADMIGTDTVMPLKFPFFSGKQSYNVFDSSIMKGAEAKFVDEETVQGLATYKYEQVIPATKVGTQGTADVYYQDDTLFYVEPTTGEIVNGSSTVKQWLKNADGTDGLVLLDGKIGFTDQNVTDSVNEASANASKLNLVSNVLPVVSLIVGHVLLVVGILLYRAASGSAETTASRQAAMAKS
jgi:hypothetical protein